ncbi:MAG: 50S ribosomal protein L10 [Chloroflexi bacterium]|nr:50S ribosomal protein L10 [Chloroflexota bacterium]
MPTQKSIAEVEELAKLLSEASVVISANHTKLNTQTVDQLRKRMRETGNQYRVIKNTLARIAAEKAGRNEVKEIISGPCAFVIGRGDPVETARVFAEHLRSNRLEVQVVGGALPGQALTPDRLEALATLPPKPVLVARLLGQLNSPAARLVSVLQAPSRGLVIALKQHLEKQQKAGAPA